jgi:3D (Asp-Asp-Asp) domain-containing protein
MNGQAHRWLLAVVVCVLTAALLSCSDEARDSHTAVVTATAYNSMPEQTDGDPTVAAWGDQLKPGRKAIAVSRDLVERGLTRGTKVRIEGQRGTYRVLDTMHSRWTDRIDIYMGEDVDAAKAWGKKQATISWR